MKSDSTDNVVCWLCDYWWVLVIALALLATAYFTRDYWYPALALN